MPFLRLETNVDVPKETAECLVKRLSGVLASELGKPEQYVSVGVQTSTAMVFGGTAEACCVGTLSCIGVLSPEVNARLSAAVAPVLAEALGVPPERYYIFFATSERHEVGWSGRTFAA